MQACKQAHKNKPAKNVISLLGADRALSLLQEAHCHFYTGHGGRGFPLLGAEEGQAEPAKPLDELGGCLGQQN